MSGGRAPRSTALPRQSERDSQRERERERERERQTDRQTMRERETVRERERQSERERSCLSVGVRLPQILHQPVVPAPYKITREVYTQFYVQSPHTKSTYSRSLCLSVSLSLCL